MRRLLYLTVLCGCTIILHPNVHAGFLCTSIKHLLNTTLHCVWSSYYLCSRDLNKVYRGTHIKPYWVNFVNQEDIITFGYSRPSHFESYKIKTIKLTARYQQAHSLKKDRDILTRDQPRWRCGHEHESATRKWFYIYLNGTSVNNHEGNDIF